MGVRYTEKGRPDLSSLMSYFYYFPYSKMLPEAIEKKV